MDLKTEKAIVSAHAAVDALVDALRLDAEQHDFRIASLIHEVTTLRQENAELKALLQAAQEQIPAKKPKKAKAVPKDAATP